MGCDEFRRRHGTIQGRSPGRGGLSKWAKLEREIRKLLSGSHFQVLTTIIDYYGIPADTPGMSDRPPGGTAIERVSHVELAMAQHCADPRFIPHLTLHESEAWVFAAADQLAELAGNGALATRLNKDTALAGGPEQINDGPTTAPSKRIYQYWPSFSKTSDGPRAVADLGLIRLRERCPHLHKWLLKIERGM